MVGPEAEPNTSAASAQHEFVVSTPGTASGATARRRERGRNGSRHRQSSVRKSARLIQPGARGSRKFANPARQIQRRIRDVLLASGRSLRRKGPQQVFGVQRPGRGVFVFEENVNVAA